MLSINYDDRESSIEIIKTALTGRNDRRAKQLRQILERLKIANKAKFVQILYTKLGIIDYKDYEGLLIEYVDSQAKLAWLLNQTKPLLSITLKPDKTPAYQTFVEFPEQKLELTSAKQVTYKVFMNGDKEPTVTRTYKNYVRVRWWPTLGIAYVPGNRSGSLFDEATGQFKSGNEFDNFEALVGVKYYPYQTNPARDLTTRRLIYNKFGQPTSTSRPNLDRGNAFRNTLFLTGGLGIRHQFLRNYYLGLGGDITPGLSLQAGANFIFQKRYELENGKIKNEYERPRTFFYVGLSIDAGIVTNLIGIFK